MKILNTITYEVEKFNIVAAKIEAQEAISFDYSKKLTDKLIILLQKMYFAKKEILAQKTEEIMLILNRLSFKNFSNVLHFFDEQHPGLSIHYLMEARTSYSENIYPQEYIESPQLLLRNNVNHKKVVAEEGDIFYKRIQLLDENRLLVHVFSPTRTRLITNLFNDEEEDEDEINIFDNDNQYNNLINKEFYNWIKENYLKDEVVSLEEKLDLYLQKKEKMVLNITLIPKHIEEKEFINLIEELIEAIDEEDDLN